MPSGPAAEPPDLRTLRAFVAVVEGGGMTAGAGRLGLTQSAVSQAVARLTRQVGVPLLLKQGRRLVPTPAGQAMVERASQLLADAGALAGAVRDAAHEPGLPLLRLGFVDSFASTAGPGLVRRVLHEMPGVRLVAWSGLAPAQADALLNRRLDAVITSDPMDELDGLVRHELLREPYVLLVPEPLRGECAGLSLLDLAARHRLVRHSARSHTGAHIDRHLRRVGVDAPRVLEFDTAEAVIAMVAGGVGWAVTTPLCLLHGQAQLAGAAVLPLPAPGFSRRLYLIGLADGDGPAQGRLAAMAQDVLSRDALQRLGSLAPWLADAVTLPKQARPSCMMSSFSSLGHQRDPKGASMKIAVLGASGRAGSEITKELAGRGHQVLAIARKPDAIPHAPGVTAVAGDASDPAALAKLIQGSDAVISALHFDVSAETLLSALRQAEVRRFLVTGGAASLEVASGKRLIDTPEFPEEWKTFAMGGIVFLEALREEKEIDWTFFSPAALIFEGPRLGHYRSGGDQLITDEAGDSKISFADYAIAMVDEVEQKRHSRARFTAGY